MIEGGIMLLHSYEELKGPPPPAFFSPPQGLRVCNMSEGGITPLHSYEELKAMGFQIIIHPMSSIFAVTKV